MLQSSLQILPGAHRECGWYFVINCLLYPGSIIHQYSHNICSKSKVHNFFSIEYWCKIASHFPCLAFTCILHPYKITFMKEEWLQSTHCSFKLTFCFCTLHYYCTVGVNTENMCIFLISIEKYLLSTCYLHGLNPPCPPPGSFKCF